MSQFARKRTGAGYDSNTIVVLVWRKDCRTRPAAVVIVTSISSAIWRVLHSSHYQYPSLAASHAPLQYLTTIHTFGVNIETRAFHDTTIAVFVDRDAKSHNGTKLHNTLHQLYRTSCDDRCRRQRSFLWNIYCWQSGRLRRVVQDHDLLVALDYYGAIVCVTPLPDSRVTRELCSASSICLCAPPLNTFA